MPHHHPNSALLAPTPCLQDDPSSSATTANTAAHGDMVSFLEDAIKVGGVRRQLGPAPSLPACLHCIAPVSAPAGCGQLPTVFPSLLQLSGICANGNFSSKLLSETDKDAFANNTTDFAGQCFDAGASVHVIAAELIACQPCLVRVLH
jgi:hypothetical protein